MSRKKDSNEGTSPWTIAAGVLLALIAFSALERWQTARVQQQALEAFQQAINDPDPLGWRKAANNRERAERAEKALQAGERCIDGKRFKKVTNGYVQVQKPC